MTITFWELPRVNQFATLKTDARTMQLSTLQNVPIPHIYYDKSEYDMKKVAKNVQMTAKFQPLELQRSIRAVLQTLTFDTLTNNEFNLYSLWGFILIYNGKYELICQNIANHSSNTVLVINMNLLMDPNHMEHLYGEEVAPRWKLIQTGIGFGLVCLLLDCANRFTIPIL
jgi:hypothetical protein